MWTGRDWRLRVISVCATGIVVLALLTFAYLVFAEVTDGTRAANTYDCADFGTRAAAQAVLDSDRSDPYRLDGDNDGAACEWLP